VNVYSLRAKARPTVSTPVSWQEVERTLQAGDPDMLVFDSAEVVERVRQNGDLFQPLLSLKQKLPAKLLNAYGPARGPRAAEPGARRRPERQPADAAAQR
jgi:DNA primase